MQVDQDNSGEIDFEEFCNVILKHKAATAKNQDEADTLDAFVALGGNVSDCPYLNQSAETSPDTSQLKLQAGALATPSSVRTITDICSSND
jgi:hypothetical protein